LVGCGTNCKAQGRDLSIKIHTVGEFVQHRLSKESVLSKYSHVVTQGLQSFTLDEVSANTVNQSFNHNVVVVGLGADLNEVECNLKGKVGS